MGVCGSRDAAGAASPRDLSRWRTDEGANERANAEDEASSQQQVQVDAGELALNHVTYGPNMQDTCLTAWEDGSIKRVLWREQNRVVQSWEVHSRAVNRIVLGPTTGTAYSCSRDTTIAATRLDVDNAEPARFTGHKLNVSTIAVSENEASLCSGGRDTQTIIWDCQTQKPKATNTTAQNVITCSKWITSSDTLVVQGSEDLSVKVWDERSSLRTPVQTIHGYVYFPLCVDVSDDGWYILTSSKGFNGVGCEGRVWDRRTGKLVTQFLGHQQDSTACCFIPRRDKSNTSIQLAATASKDGTVKIWDANSGNEPAHSCEAHEPTARMFTSLVVVSPMTLLASTFTGTVHELKLNEAAAALELCDILAECAEHLRKSPFDYQQLLSAHVTRVWNGLVLQVERQMIVRRGTGIPGLGRFAFLRNAQPLQPVFILADRFIHSYGASWRRPPPALLTPTVDVNVGVLANDIGLPKGETQSTLDAILEWIGTKVRKGKAHDRLRVGRVGCFSFDGNAVAFAFDPTFAKEVAAVGAINPRGKDTATTITNNGAIVPSSSAPALLPLQSNNTNARAAIDRDNTPKALMQPSTTTISFGDDAVSHARAMQDNNRTKAEHARHDRHHRRPSHGSLERSFAVVDNGSDSCNDDNNHNNEVPARQLLPRFLIAQKRVPESVQAMRDVQAPAHDAVMQRAYQQQMEKLDQQFQATAAMDAEIARRSEAVQLRKLQDRAENAIRQRDLNAFLNEQIQQKRHRTKHKFVPLALSSTIAEQYAASVAESAEYTSATIVPHDSPAHAEEKQRQKEKLRSHLNEQVAMKATLRKDKRVIEQAETAYFVEKLAQQNDLEQRERAELQRRDRDMLLTTWGQQRALRDKQRQNEKLLLHHHE
ncbi:TPA: hypothetical protein N0F65_003832 [Lagenidium giganteum]|uniref:Uncharacterized protein n=1 Tax=Lagenidium giganteum TaxID=4803 RepID=A0AAV2YSI1_9STRA|nr:TPA: hypothetical protein N0F65_003832 [Lagenidium giganteum]